MLQGDGIIWITRARAIMSPVVDVSTLYAEVWTSQKGDLRYVISFILSKLRLGAPPL